MELIGKLQILTKTGKTGNTYKVLSFTESKTGQTVEVGTEFNNAQAIAKLSCLMLELVQNSK